MRPHSTTIWGCLGWGMPGVVFSFQTGRVFLWRSWLMHLATQGSPRRVQLQWKWLRQVLTEKIKWAHEGPKHTQRTKSRCAKCCKAYTDITWVPLLYTSFMPKEKTQMVPEPIHLFSHTVCTCAATPTPFPGPTGWLWLIRLITQPSSSCSCSTSGKRQRFDDFDVMKAALTWPLGSLGIMQWSTSTSRQHLSATIWLAQKTDVDHSTGIHTWIGLDHRRFGHGPGIRIACRSVCPRPVFSKGGAAAKIFAAMLGAPRSPQPTLWYWLT